MDSVETVVAGSGIGGAALALALGRAGREVLLVEREIRPLSIPRPEILAQVTVGRLGIDLADAALPLRSLRFHVGAHRVAKIDPSDLARVGAQPYSTDPERTRAAILAAALATGNVKIERGVEAREVLVESGRAVGIRGVRNGRDYEVRAKIVVGDDGVKSAVRASLGIECDLSLFPFEFWGLRLPRPRDLAPDIARAYLRPAGFGDGLSGGLFLPLPDGNLTAVLLAPVGTWEARYGSDSAAFFRELDDLTPLADSVREGIGGDPSRLFRIRRPWGHARAYHVSERAAGAVLLGDAAHPMSPAGGQGANAAIHDAFSLAPEIRVVLDGRVEAREAFARYEARRRPANDASLDFTRLAARAVSSLHRAPFLARLLPTALALFERSEGAKDRLLRSVSTAFVGTD